MIAKLFDRQASLRAPAFPVLCNTCQAENTLCFARHVDIHLFRNGDGDGDEDRELNEEGESERKTSLL